MSEDLISLIIYLALALVGIIASAYKNKAKKQQSSKTGRTEVPRSFPADPEKDFGPELGPLYDLFDIPKPKPEEPVYESIENGPSVEESGMKVDTQEAAQELAGLELDRNVSAVEVNEVESFEEGQSDIQKMIAKYEAIRHELEDNGIIDDIAKGEIVSVEAEEAAREKRVAEKEFFDIRKAIIYSEILNKKEF